MTDAPRPPAETLAERLAAAIDRRLTGRAVIRGAAGQSPAGLLAVGDLPWNQGLALLATRLLLRAFFRTVEVEGLEHIPRTGGAIVVSWHPNGLIDPALICACLPRPLVFGARDGLFRWPVLGWLLHAVGAVPIRRAVDHAAGAGLSEQDRRTANNRSLGALAGVVARGGLSCLFPEGDSHDAPHLIRLKTGAARMYYLARQADPEHPPAIVPVGLHYDAKHRFRSHALVRFHSPLRLPLDLDLAPPTDEPEAVMRDRCRRLTDLLEQALQRAVGVTESWELHHCMARAARLLRAERARRAGADLDRPSMLESQVAFWRTWEGHANGMRRDPDRVQVLMTRIAEYGADLRALGLEDADLDHAPLAGRPGQATLLLLQVAGVFFVMPSFIVLGGVVNALPYAILRIGAAVAAKRKKDVATILLLGGAVLYPLTWLTAAWLAHEAAWRLHETSHLIPAAPLLASATVLLLAIGGGMLALRYLRLVRETARAVRVRVTRLHRRRAIRTLLAERSRLADELEWLEEGLDLPGAVTQEGAVLATEDVPPGGRA